MAFPKVSCTLGLATHISSATLYIWYYDSLEPLLASLGSHTNFVIFSWHSHKNRFSRHLCLQKVCDFSGIHSFPLQMVQPHKTEFSSTPPFLCILLARIQSCVRIYIWQRQQNVKKKLKYFLHACPAEEGNEYEDDLLGASDSRYKYLQEHRIKFSKNGKLILYIDPNGKKHYIRPDTPKTREACLLCGIDPGELQ